MYEDIDKVKSDIKNHIEKITQEKTVEFVHESREYFILKGLNGSFRFDACFIQCRTEDDFPVPIEQRIDDASNGVVFTKGKTYRFTIDEQQKPMPRYVVVEL